MFCIKSVAFYTILTMEIYTQATRNSSYSSRKLGPPPPPPCCKHWQWKPYAARPVQTFMNKYYLSAPEMYDSHAKDVTEEDSLIVLDDGDQVINFVFRSLLTTHIYPSLQRIFFEKYVLGLPHRVQLFCNENLKSVARVTVWRICIFNVIGNRTLLDLNQTDF